MIIYIYIYIYIYTCIYTTITGSTFGGEYPSPDDETFLEFNRINHRVFGKIVPTTIVSILCPAWLTYIIAKYIIGYPQEIWLYADEDVP